MLYQTDFSHKLVIGKENLASFLLHQAAKCCSMMCLGKFALPDITQYDYRTGSHHNTCAETIYFGALLAQYLPASTSSQERNQCCFIS